MGAILLVFAILNGFGMTSADFLPLVQSLLVAFLSGAIISFVCQLFIFPTTAARALLDELFLSSKNSKELLELAFGCFLSVVTPVEHAKMHRLQEGVKQNYGRIVTHLEATHLEIYYGLLSPGELASFSERTKKVLQHLHTVASCCRPRTMRPRQENLLLQSIVVSVEDDEIGEEGENLTEDFRSAIRNLLGHMVQISMESLEFMQHFFDGKYAISDNIGSAQNFAGHLQSAMLSLESEQHQVLQRMLDGRGSVLNSWDDMFYVYFFLFTLRAFVIELKLLLEETEAIMVSSQLRISLYSSKNCMSVYL